MDLLYGNIAKYNSASVVLHSMTRVAPYQLDIKKTKRQSKQTLREGRSVPRPTPKREEARLPCVRTSRHRSQTTHTSQVLRCGALAADLSFLTAPRRVASPRQASAPQARSRGWREVTPLLGGGCTAYSPFPWAAGAETSPVPQWRQRDRGQRPPG